MNHPLPRAKYSDARLYSTERPTIRNDEPSIHHPHHACNVLMLSGYYMYHQS
jgi:hypothetical protein